MNEQMQSGMEEATRLTRQGRLDEATAAIQRAQAAVRSSRPQSREVLAKDR